MGDLIVYRSTHQSVLEAWDKWQADRLAWQDRVRTVAEQIDVNPDRFLINSTTGALLGIKPEGDVVPDGWRTDRGRWVPRMSTSSGKNTQKLFDDVKRPYARDYMPGMPPMYWGDDDFGQICRPGVVSLEGAVWVSWTIQPPETEIDGTVWERAKLSEYYAAVEAQEDRDAALVPAGGA